jgi:hypothetical protein
MVLITRSLSWFDGDGFYDPAAGDYPEFCGDEQFFRRSRTCSVRRERTNTPMQALVTMNDEQHVEAARRFAEHILKHGGSADDQSLQFDAHQLLSRDLRTDELTILTESLGQLAAFYRDHAKEAGELIQTGESEPDASMNAETLAAWTMLCNEMMNLDEVLNK